MRSGKPFVFFHTWEVTYQLLDQVIKEQKTIDLDISVDEKGQPYLGHSDEYHKKSGEPYFKTMALWEAIEMVANSDIFAMVDCKHYDAWPVIEEVVSKIGPERCLVCGFVNELKYSHSREINEPDFLTEWSPIEKFTRLKEKFPNVTITPCSKWLPGDLLASDKYIQLVGNVRGTLKQFNADTVCLSVPDETINDKWLKYFLEEGIIPHISIDNTDTSKLSELYIGETDYLQKVSRITEL